MSDGAKGATDREIARYLGEFDLNRVRPRRNELVREGRIVGRFKKVCQYTGKTVYLWHAPYISYIKEPFVSFGTPEI